MELILVSTSELSKLQRKKKLLLSFIVVTFLVLAVFVLLAFLFQNRETQALWIVSGTILTSCWLTIVLYVITKMYFPLDDYARFMKKALSRDRTVNDVMIIRQEPELDSYSGFACKIIGVEEIDEHTKFQIRYEATVSLIIDRTKKYEIETFDGFLLRIKEIS
jgi:hypothetical protein